MKATLRMSQGPRSSAPPSAMMMLARAGAQDVEQPEGGGHEQRRQADGGTGAAEERELHERAVDERGEGEERVEAAGEIVVGDAELPGEQRIGDDDGDGEQGGARRHAAGEEREHPQRQQAELQIDQLADGGAAEGEAERVEHLDVEREGAVEGERREPDAVPVQVALGDAEVIGERVPAVAGDEGVEQRHQGEQGCDDDDGDERARRARSRRSLARVDAQRAQRGRRRGGDRHGDERQQRGLEEDVQRGQGEDGVGEDEEAKREPRRQRLDERLGRAVQAPPQRRADGERGQIDGGERGQRLQDGEELAAAQAERRIGDEVARRRMQPRVRAHEREPGGEHGDERQRAAHAPP
jgi:hypothetical protein